MPFAAVLIVSLAGCRGDRGVATSDGPRHSNLRVLAMLYGRFQNAHQGRSPSSEKEFKQFVNQHGQETLRLADINNLDELLVSERDGQPYVVLYGKAAAKSKQSAPIAYEQQGADGTRYVGYRLGYVEELDNAEFRKLAPDSSPAPPAVSSPREDPP